MLEQILESLASPVAVLVAVLLVVVASSLWSAARSPGPWGVPILGYYPFLKKQYHIQLCELSRKHGEVYLINIAGQIFVHLSTLRAIREAHVNKVDCFPIRSRKHGVFQETLGEGLLYSVGEQWRVQRKFFSQAMREIGVIPKNANQRGPIEDIVLKTLEIFDEKRGEPLTIFPFVTKQCTAVVLRLILGDDITDEEETQMGEAYAKVLEPAYGTNLLLIGDIAKYLLSRDPGYNEMLASSEKMQAILRKILQRHEDTFDAENPPRDLIDLYLREKTSKEKKGDLSIRYFTDVALVSTLEHVYGDGSVSIAVLISEFYLTLSRYPDVQDAVHEELFRVVGTERLPTWEDRPNLPLTNSLILELIRKVNVFSIFPEMECTMDTTVLGVKVPKGSVTLMNMWAVNHNLETYENPDQFDATRFLPEKKAEPPFLFGIGRRACIGENLVMTEIFCFLSSTLQNFMILPVENSDGTEPNLEQDLGALYAGRLRFLPRVVSRYSY